TRGVPAGARSGSDRGRRPYRRRLPRSRALSPSSVRDGWSPPCCRTEGDRERDAKDHHAATTAVCWLRTAAIFRQPSILRNLIWPLATRPRRRNTAASGPEPLRTGRLVAVR